jgi:hypothetical protein
MESFQDGYRDGNGEILVRVDLGLEPKDWLITSEDAVACPRNLHHKKKFPHFRLSQSATSHFVSFHWERTPYHTAKFKRLSPSGSGW